MSDICPERREISRPRAGKADFEFDHSIKSGKALQVITAVGQHTSPRVCSWRDDDDDDEDHTFPALQISLLRTAGSDDISCSWCPRDLFASSKPCHLNALTFGLLRAWTLGLLRAFSLTFDLLRDWTFGLLRALTLGLFRGLTFELLSVWSLGLLFEVYSRSFCFQ